MIVRLLIAETSLANITSTLLFPNSFRSFRSSFLFPQLHFRCSITNMSAPTCAGCSKTAADLHLDNLKECAKCHTTQYCSRDCQKADWKAHKKICSTNANARASGMPRVDDSTTYRAPHLNDLEFHVNKPFTKLDQGTYLHDRPEQDVYKLLIDSYRMRQEDDFKLEKKPRARSVYTGAKSSIEPFQDYLKLAATRRNLLPPWWNAEKQKECEAFGESGAWSDLRKKVTKAETIAHYGDDKMPMQLRMLAEVVYGQGSMGQDGSMMRKMQSQMENGGPGNGMVSSMMDISGLVR